MHQQQQCVVQQAVLKQSRSFMRQQMLQQRLVLVR
jgi:hypothetical protein